MLQCTRNENVPFLYRNATGVFSIRTKQHGLFRCLSVHPFIDSRWFAKVTQNLSKSEIGQNQYNECQTLSPTNFYIPPCADGYKPVYYRVGPSTPTTMFRLTSSRSRAINHMKPTCISNAKKLFPKHQSKPHIEMILIYTASIWKIKTLHFPFQKIKKIKKKPQICTAAATLVRFDVKVVPWVLG